MNEPKATAHAQAVPASAPPSPETPTPAELGAREFLTSHAWPSGLQDTLLKSLKKIPMRFFICDDSGSMITPDGHRLVGTNSRNMGLVSCTRWAELSSALSFHAKLAYVASAPTEFRMLNGAAPITIGDGAADGHEKLQTFQALLDGSPGGNTPLCAHIAQVSAAFYDLLIADCNISGDCEDPLDARPTACFRPEGLCGHHD